MKTYITFLAAALVIFTVSSCKKGDEDPALSLQTRKARISGEWNLEQQNITWSNGDQYGISTYGSTVSDGNTCTVLMYFDNTLYANETYSYTENSLTINRDGTWSSIKSSSYTVIIDNDEYSTTTGTQVVEESGSWSFAYKSAEDYKNKERVIFHVLKSNELRGPSTTVTVYENDPSNPVTSYNPAFNHAQSFSNGANSRTYDLIKLKADEMKWELVQSNKQDVTDQVQNLSTNEHTEIETLLWKAN